MRPARDRWINPTLALCICAAAGSAFSWLAGYRCAVVLITTTGPTFRFTRALDRAAAAVPQLDAANILFIQFYSVIRLNGPSAVSGDRVLEFTTHSTLRASRPSLRWAVCLSGVSKR